MTTDHENTIIDALQRIAAALDRAYPPPKPVEAKDEKQAKPDKTIKTA